MKAILQIILMIAVVFLGYWIYTMFETPIKFEQARDAREKAVIERLVDIRTIQRSYRQKYGKFAGSFEDLANYYHNDSLEVEFAVGSADDSAAMGNLIRETSFLRIYDTLFLNKEAGFKIEDLKYIPYSDVATGARVEFQLDTAVLVTESKVSVPVFQAYAPFVTFLKDLDEQELINYRDERVNTLGRDDGIKVGAIFEANNEAGNWE
ncbi:MAG: hypothetical protein R3Y61_07420 [Rikenellaceae bacterium]